MQDCGNSTADALELLQSSTKLPIRTYRSYSLVVQYWNNCTWKPGKLNNFSLYLPYDRYQKIQIFVSNKYDNSFTYFQTEEPMNTTGNWDAIASNNGSLSVGFKVIITCTVETLYSTIYYSKYFIELNLDKSTQYVALWTHKRHSIPRPFGRAMECLLWVFQQKLTVL